MRIQTASLIMLAVASAVLFAAEETATPTWSPRSPSARPQSKIAPSPAYDKMKTLVGSWDGTTNEGGKQLQTNARFQLVAENSVLAGWLAEGTPHEMVTMFHMDGDQLMATHYCAAHNQPRLVLATGGDPNRLVFKFKDGTNIQPDAGHMQQVAFIFDGSSHHIEEWTYLQGGKEETTRFDFKRKQ